MYSYRIEQALRAATILHKDQVRKGAAPIPYVSHLFAVLMIASDYTKDEDVLIACLLHDTLEDTDYTAQELEDDFGGVVRILVETVSEPKTPEFKKLPWRDQKAHYIKNIRDAEENTFIVVASDKIHNMRAIVEEYYDDHVRFMADFNGSLDERLVVYENIRDLLNKKLRNDIVEEFNHVFEEYKNFIQDVKKTKEDQERF